MREEKMKYAIYYETEFGRVSAESEDPDELVTAHPKLKDIAKRLSNKPQPRKKDNINVVKPQRAKAASSKVPETTAILRELESNVLNSKFFNVPRTTGETREKLHELTGNYFASRKVSQALGILKDRGKLRRKGKRNFFQYSLS
jgi:hypothetical protein